MDKKPTVPGKIKNTEQVTFKDKNLDSVRFIEINSYPAIGEHATAKYYVDQITDESLLLGNKFSNDFKNHCLIDISHVKLNAQSTNDNHALTKL